MTKDKVKNEHIVPQSYLEFFSQNDQIFVFDKMTQKKYLSNIKNIAVERYFYDFPQEKEGRVDTQIIESFLSEFEDRQKRLFKQLEKKIESLSSFRDQANFYGHKVINSIQKEDLAICIAIQFLRTKHFRFFLSDIWEVTTPLIENQVQAEVENDLHKAKKIFNLDENNVQALKPILIGSIWPYINSVADENRNMSIWQATMMLDAQKLGSILQKHIWLIGYNETGEKLYTSDNPVCLRGHKNQKGFDSEGAEIIFPLTPKIIFILREKRYFNQFIGCDSTIFPLCREDVEIYNIMQVRSSNRQVFSITEEFELIDEIQHSNPEMLSLKRIWKCDLPDRD